MGRGGGVMGSGTQRTKCAEVGWSGKGGGDQGPRGISVQRWVGVGRGGGVMGSGTQRTKSAGVGWSGGGGGDGVKDPEG